MRIRWCRVPECRAMRNSTGLCPAHARLAAGVVGTSRDRDVVNARNRAIEQCQRAGVAYSTKEKQ